MPLPLMYFNPLTTEQANPVLAGAGAAQSLIGQGVTNQQLLATLIGQKLQNQITGVQAQYAQPEAQQELLKNQLMNQILQPQAQYAPQMTLADLALKRALPGYYGAMAADASARAGYTGAQTNLLKQQTPYMVQKAQADVYSDPLLSRANQLAMAQTQAATNPALQGNLSQLGFGATPMGSTPVPMALPGMGMAPNALNAPRLMNGDPMQNYLMFGSPLSPFMTMQLQAMQKGMETQQTAQANDYSAALKQAQTDAVTGNQMSNAVEQFMQSYGKTDETGFLAGRLPAVSSAAQQADNASNQLVAMMTKQLNPKQLTNQELRFATTLKPNRAMNAQMAQMSADFWKQKAIRINEQAAFLNAAKNDGIDVYTANSLWNQYNNQRPVYDFANNSPNPQYQGTWRDFLNPQAVAAAQAGRPYVLPPSFQNAHEAKNWFKSLNSDDQKTIRAQGGQ